MHIVKVKTNYAGDLPRESSIPRWRRVGTLLNYSYHYHIEFHIKCVTPISHTQCFLKWRQILWVLMPMEVYFHAYAINKNLSPYRYRKKALMRFSVCKRQFLISTISELLIIALCTYLVLTDLYLRPARLSISNTRIGTYLAWPWPRYIGRYVRTLPIFPLKYYK